MNKTYESVIQGFSYSIIHNQDQGILLSQLTILSEFISFLTFLYKYTIYVWTFSTKPWSLQLPGFIVRIQIF